MREDYKCLLLGLAFETTVFLFSALFSETSVSASKNGKAVWGGGAEDMISSLCYVQYSEHI